METTQTPARPATRRPAGRRTAGPDAAKNCLVVEGRRVIVGFSALPGGHRWVPAISVDPEAPYQRRHVFTACDAHAARSPGEAMAAAGRMAKDWPKLACRELIATVHWLGVGAAAS